MLKQNQYTPPIVFHPGETLAEKLAESDMSTEDLQAKTGVVASDWEGVIKGVININIFYAVILEQQFKIDRHIWLRMQRKYDEYIKNRKK